MAEAKGEKTRDVALDSYDLKFTFINILTLKYFLKCALNFLPELRCPGDKCPPGGSECGEPPDLPGVN